MTSPPIPTPSPSLPSLQLAETDESVTKSGSILRSMARRVLTDKLVQGIIVLLQMGICGLIIYFRYYRD